MGNIPGQVAEGEVRGDNFRFAAPIAGEINALGVAVIIPAGGAVLKAKLHGDGVSGRNLPTVALEVDIHGAALVLKAAPQGNPLPAGRFCAIVQGMAGDGLRGTGKRFYRSHCQLLISGAPAHAQCGG